MRSAGEFWGRFRAGTVTFDDDEASRGTGSPPGHTTSDYLRKFGRSASREDPRISRCRVAMRQKAVRDAYRHKKVQAFIGAMIMGNFLSECTQKQLDPWEEKYPDVWYIVETTWNLLFLLELLWNAYGNWLCDFFTSRWNLFDLLVVVISIPNMAKSTNLGSWSKLRMLRAFRVFRLFKRIESLNRILVALTRSVPGILNAGAVMVLVMCIYAILGVDLFGRFAEDGEFINIEGTEIKLLTPRGLTYGNEYYGTFGRSLYTLFQVLTGDSWSEAVARPVLFAEGGEWYWIFYVSFITINGVVLINVVVAVLLEKMVGGVGPEEGVEEESSEGDPRLHRMEKKVDKIEVECTARLDRLTELLTEVHEQLMIDGEACTFTADGVRQACTLTADRVNGTEKGAMVC